MNSKDVVFLAKRMKGHSLFILSDSCPDTYRPKGEVFEEIKKRWEKTNVLRFDKMKRGWCTSGDFAKPGVRPSTDETITAIAKWIRKYMWPPPPGSNAASLRLFCREGKADWVEKLCAQAVPCTG